MTSAIVPRDRTASGLRIGSFQFAEPIGQILLVAIFIEAKRSELHIMGGPQKHR